MAPLRHRRRQLLADHRRVELDVSRLFCRRGYTGPRDRDREQQERIRCCDLGRDGGCRIGDAYRSSAASAASSAPSSAAASASVGSLDDVAPDGWRYRSGGTDAERLARNVERRNADDVHLPVAALRQEWRRLRRDFRGDHRDVRPRLRRRRRHRSSLGDGEQRRRLGNGVVGTDRGDTGRADIPGNVPLLVHLRLERVRAVGSL